MLDSGVLSGVLFDEVPHLTLRAVAHQHGLPLTLWTSKYLDAAERLLREHDLPDHSFPLNFESFCAAFSSVQAPSERFLKRLGELRLGGHAHFAHPLYREIKNHYCVRLFELQILIQARRTCKRASLPFVFQSGTFPLHLDHDEGSVLAIGPVLVAEETDSAADGDLRQRAESDIRHFNACVDQLRQGSPPGTRAFPLLYADDYLLRLYLYRQKISGVTLQRKAAASRRTLGFMRKLPLGELEGKASPTFFARVAAGSAAHLEGSKGEITFTAFQAGAGPTSGVISFSGGRASVGAPLGQSSDPDFVEAYAKHTEVSYANWSASVAESLSQLRRWLSTWSTSSLKDPGPIAERGSASGRRLARYLASTFAAYECTIYRLAYVEGKARLRVVGAFSSDPDGPGRLDRMQAHMDAIVGTHAQHGSISYRCMLQDAVQYCEHWDAATRTATPASQPITYPKGDVSDWGTSACAMPIRVNGVLWGVLQLIGRRPHCFPEPARARAGEACDIIGGHLFRSEILASIYSINKTIVSADMPSRDKRSAIECELSGMFGSRTFAILRIDQFDRRAPVVVFLESGRPDLVNAASKLEDKDYFEPLLRFSRSENDSWGATIGSDQFRRMFGGSSRKRFYEESKGGFIYLLKLRWELSAKAVLPGVIVLTYPRAMADQENWRHNVDFVAQYISTISGTLYNSDLWERRLRDKIGHELSKTALNLEASVARLKEAARRAPTASQGIMHAVPAVMGDLGRHSKSLKKYVEILTTQRDITDFDNDPRLYLVEQMRLDYRNSSDRRGVSFRDAYNSAFVGQKDRFEERRIELPRFDPALGHQIDMDELCLREVLSTLVDNILKYAKQETSLLLRDTSDRVVGVTISNIGLKLDPVEESAIFDDEVRGRLASELLPHEGSGFGLWFAQKAMHAWGCGLRHVQRPLKDGDSRHAWHDFTLVFQRRMILS